MINKSIVVIGMILVCLVSCDNKQNMPNSYDDVQVQTDVTGNWFGDIQDSLFVIEMSIAQSNDTIAGVGLINSHDRFFISGNNIDNDVKLLFRNESTVMTFLGIASDSMMTGEIEGQIFNKSWVEFSRR